MEAEHTPLPWSLEPNGHAFNLRSPDRGAHHAILLGMTYNNEGEHEANAELIVRACNSYYELVKACEIGLAALQDDGVDQDSYGIEGSRYRTIAAVLSKAKEGKNFVTHSPEAILEVLSMAAKRCEDGTDEEYRGAMRAIEWIAHELEIRINEEGS